jgi:ATP-dependent exoDNAse (exonuclease V) beta subunit
MLPPSVLWLPLRSSSMLDIKRILVEAGAGCGKTTSIVQKFKSSCASQKEGGLGLSPQDILLLTFTDAAAKEMKGRIENQCPDLDLTKGFIGTFHSFCLRLLKASSYAGIDQNSDIFSEKEISVLYKNEFLKELSQLENLSEVLSTLSLSNVLELTLKGSTPQKALEDAFGLLQNKWDNFENKLKKEINSLDLEEFSETDWPLQSLKLLEEKNIEAQIVFSQKKSLKNLAQNNPFLVENVKRIRDLLSKNSFTPLLNQWDKEKNTLIFLHEEIKKTRKKLPPFLTFSEIERLTLEGLEEKSLKIPPFKLIIVDEFQDTSPEQWSIIEKISQTETHWYLVGDPKQSIYGFRKADIRLYNELRKKLELQSLEKNYRSSKEILNFVNILQERLFVNPSDPKAQILTPGRDIASPNEAIRVHQYTQIKNEFILQNILKRHEEASDLNHAVLFREWKKLYEFSEYLTQQKVSFKIEGSDNYLDHYLTHLFCEFLTCVFHNQSKRDEVLVAFDIELTEEKTRSFKENNDFLSAFYEFTCQIQPQRWPQGREWISCMERFLFEKIQKGFLNWQDILQILIKKNYDSFDLLIPENIKDEKLSITLLTIHGSKGLEFDCVHLPDPRESSSNRNSFEEDEIPFSYQVTPQKKSRSLYFELQKAERQGKVEAEQKRLFYVAITRAKKTLDFYLYKEKPSTTSSTSDVPWYQIWKEDLKIEKFKWSQILLPQKNSLHCFWKEQNLESNQDENFFIAPLKKENATEHLNSIKSKKIETSAQLWGNSLHSCLEYWNGDEDQIDKIVEKENIAFRENFKSCLKALRNHSDLFNFWKALRDQHSSWVIFREENLIETTSEKNLNLRADVLMLSPTEAIVIDWKTASTPGDFTDDRLNKIEEQLKRYGQSLKNHIPQVTLLAIGIFRDEKIKLEGKVKTLLKKQI